MTKGKTSPRYADEEEADAADALFVEMLRYWDSIFEPKKGHWLHPDDVKEHAKLRRAIKLLLDFMTP